jgi:hypothetical protein
MIFTWLCAFARIGTNELPQPWVIDTSAAQRAASVSQNFISDLQKGDSAKLANYYAQCKSTERCFNATTAKDTVVETQKYLSTAKPKKVTLVGVNINTIVSLDDNSPKKTSVQTELEYQFKQGWRLVHLAYVEQDHHVQIQGLRITKLNDSLINLNKVSLTHASTSQYLALCLMLSMQLISFIALFLCIITPNLKHRWFWSLFVLLGFCSIYFDWTAQAYGINPVSFQMLATHVSRISKETPLLLNFSLPIGAIIFLIKYFLNKKKQNIAG